MAPSWSWTARNTRRAKGRRTPRNVPPKWARWTRSPSGFCPCWQNESDFQTPFLMKTKLLGLICLLLAGAVARAGAAETYTVAIFDFESKDEGVRDLGPKVAALL